MLKQYSKPKCTDIAVCMCYFSSVGYDNPRKNFMRVKKMLDDAKIPLFTAECIIGETPQLIPEPTLLTRAESSLFYKEQLFNLLEKKIPSNYTKLIFMDSDLIFTIADWVDVISKKLNKYSAVQPFGTGLYLDTSENVFGKATSYAKYRHLYGGSDGHPGFCWAFNRNFLKEIGGFFDKAIIGSGDSAISTVFNQTRYCYRYPFSPYYFNYKSPFIQDNYLRWLNNAHKKARSMTYLDIDIYHLYHGSTINRQYNDRHTFPDLLKIKKWEDAVSVNEYGMYELKNPGINQLLKNYFLSRKEDD